ncbi:hypothetical protein ACIOWG_14190 [Streptomyces sp. NPDC087658]|uniref:hypothetical protein n=1 Tax=Streptomyces sp. NPDC087658 TaxID=3365800 RepID=UPI00382BE6A1
MTVKQSGRCGMSPASAQSLESGTNPANISSGPCPAGLTIRYVPLPSAIGV